MVQTSTIVTISVGTVITGALGNSSFAFRRIKDALD